MAMKWTPGRLKDRETIEYFLLPELKRVQRTDDDWKNFFNYSERGFEIKDKTRGIDSILEGKRWRGINMEMYEEGLVEGSMPYYVLLGGYLCVLPPPRSVVDFMKRELFKGVDADLIERVYQDILIEKKTWKYKFEVLMLKLRMLFFRLKLLVGIL